MTCANCGGINTHLMPIPGTDLYQCEDRALCREMMILKALLEPVDE